MNVTSAEFVISAVGPGQYPDDDLPEIVLLGRSNVGKSTFINTLIGRKTLARTSSQPGKTQTMNFYLINDAFRFVDMPGYGYARVSRAERAKWGQMIEDYLQNRSNRRLVIQLVDSRHEPTEDDCLMANWLIYYGMDPLVIATKADKLTKNRQKKARDNISRTLGVGRDALILFSAVDRMGKNEAWEAIQRNLDAAVE